MFYVYNSIDYLHQFGYLHRQIAATADPCVRSEVNEVNISQAHQDIEHLVDSRELIITFNESDLMLAPIKHPEIASSMF